MDGEIVFGSPLLHLRLLLFMSYVFFLEQLLLVGWFVCIFIMQRPGVNSFDCTNGGGFYQLKSPIKAIQAEEFTTELYITRMHTAHTKEK
jgi:hypothetical protein